jgi:hypothetical protein
MNQSVKSAKKPIFHVGLVFFVLSYGLILHRCNSEAENFENRTQTDGFSAQYNSVVPLASDTLR